MVLGWSKERKVT